MYIHIPCNKYMCSYTYIYILLYYIILCYIILYYVILYYIILKLLIYKIMKTIMIVNTTYASIYERGFNHYCTKVFILPNKYMCIFMALYLELIFNISKDQTKHHVVSLHFQVNYTYKSSFIKQVNHHSYHLQLGHVPHESWKFTNFCSLETCGHLDKKVNIF